MHYPQVLVPKKGVDCIRNASIGAAIPYQRYGATRRRSFFLRW
jgi:hypothetical protein